STARDRNRKGGNLALGAISPPKFLGCGARGGFLEPRHLSGIFLRTPRRSLRTGAHRGIPRPAHSGRGVACSASHAQRAANRRPGGANRFHLPSCERADLKAAAAKIKDAKMNVSF